MGGGLLRLVLLWGLLLSVGACSKKPDERTTPAEMLQFYKGKLPLGTSVRAAEKLMEEDGFSVEHKRGARWKGRSGLTFLHCLRDDGQMVKRRWEFALFHDGSVITDIEMRSATVYP